MGNPDKLSLEGALVYNSGTFPHEPAIYARRKFDGYRKLNNITVNLVGYAYVLTDFFLSQKFEHNY